MSAKHFRTEKTASTNANKDGVKGPHSRAGAGNGKRPARTFLSFYVVFFVKIVNKKAFFRESNAVISFTFNSIVKTISKYFIQLAPSNC